MKFEYLKFYSLIFSRTKRAFEVKKTCFLVSQKLSFRLKKQTNKIVADTALNHVNFFMDTVTLICLTH